MPWEGTEGRDMPATVKVGELSTPEGASGRLRSFSSWGSLLGALRVLGSSNSEAHRLRDWSGILRRSETSIDDSVEVMAEGGKFSGVCSNPGECRDGGYSGMQYCVSDAEKDIMPANICETCEIRSLSTSTLELASALWCMTQASRAELAVCAILHY
jgi:hypothetical protein